MARNAQPIQTGMIAQSQAATPQSAPQTQENQSLNVRLDNFLRSQRMEKRFQELLGKRTPQFMSALIALMNATPELQTAFYEAPLTVVQAAMKAAAMDLPIDPVLGYAYIVPFRNNKAKRQDGSIYSRTEAQFIMSYRAMINLALRSGVYRDINVTDVKEGELVSVDRLSGAYTFDWVQDEDERRGRKTIGYAAYFQLVNGARKTVYMSTEEINRHRDTFSKSKNGFGWRENYDAMCKKTVLRRLISKWGIMSIEYRMSKNTALADAMAEEFGPDDAPELLSPLTDQADAAPAPEGESYEDLLPPGEKMSGEDDQT